MTKFRSIFIIVFSSIIVFSTDQLNVRAQATAEKAEKEMAKDEVYFSIARRIISVSESPVTAIVGEVDGLIEIVSITKEPDGKSLVTIKEAATSGTPKSIRLKFAPPPQGNEWTWVEFEENRKFYPVDKLFPYAKDEIGKRRQLVDSQWAAFLETLNKQGEAANKALDTAKAVTKNDPPMLATIANIRKSLIQAKQDNDKDGLINAYRELAQQAEPITALGDTYPDLKTNDAYLRLLEEYKTSINQTNAALKAYVKSVETYNEILQRLPFALVAYGLQFTKIEPNISEE
jgi:LemA protein